MAKEFSVLHEIDESWCSYDKSVAKSHLENYGVIFIDPIHRDPIDNGYDLEEIFACWKESRP